MWDALTSHKKGFRQKGNFQDSHALVFIVFPVLQVAFSRFFPVQQVRYSRFFPVHQAHGIVTNKNDHPLQWEIPTTQRFCEDFIRKMLLSNSPQEKQKDYIGRPNLLRLERRLGCCLLYIERLANSVQGCKIFPNGKCVVIWLGMVPSDYPASLCAPTAYPCALYKKITNF